MSRYLNVEEMSDEELSDAYYNWNCEMINAFSGRSYPKDYPRGNNNGYSYRLNGNHLCFNELQAYCKHREVSRNG